MPLFQTSVLKSNLALLNPAEVEKAYRKYQKYFWNTTIQENIRNSKEEQYQATFLTELFVNILGYTLNPNPKFNITTEFKNQKNARKADGAILKEGNAIGVIELKGTRTKDLESIRKQAFDYKANQKGAVYVITSNFEKLRFYINDATEFEEFDLFTLSQNRFKLLYLCLHIDKVLNNVPLKIKEASIAEEEQITKAFYQDYSIFKRELYRDLVKKNAKTVKSKLSGAEATDNQDDILKLEKNVKLTLFKKSQKLIDRFLFIFFAEDRTLLPSNSTLQILNKWKDDWNFGDERPLYGLFKQYFNFLDLGRKGTEKRAEIYAYNGGLFRPDSILDALEIDNELLYKYALKLSNYDFESQVDVNILGHIFENSLNEIESINAEIEGGDFDKQKSKRKKDGVFYTPKYITKYIVENTVGKLCEEKKIELGFQEEEYFKGRAKRPKKKINELVKLLDYYREWLLQLTICDPACGSGAFLNQALDFLIKEHTYVDELKAKVLGGGLQFPDIENTILENNIYGVDLNEESVEIAKLSLWLRTAQPRRKLNDLSSNIQCGNSLIDSKSVAGDKAFNWTTAFSKVFENGGFDVIIGNPPYVSNKDMHRHGMQNQIAFWNDTFESSKSGNYDIFIPFIEQGMRLLKKGRILSFIIPNKFLSAKYSKSLLNLVSNNYTFKEVIDYSNVRVFADASVYPIIITIANKKQKEKDKNSVNRIIVEEGAFEEFGIHRKWDYINLKYLDSIDKESDSIISKIEKSKNLLNKDLSFEPGINGFQFTNYAQCVTDGKVNDDSKRLTVTGTIDPHIFTNSITRYKKKDYNEPYITYNPEIISEGKWALFCKPKIMVAGMTKIIEASLDVEGKYAPAVSVYSICGELEKLYQVQLIINSKLINWFFKYKFSDKHMAGGYISVNNLLLKKIPFKKIDNNERTELLVQNANSLRIELESLISRLTRLLKSKYEIEKLPRKLKNWNDISFGDFIKELNKTFKITNKQREKDALIDLGEGQKEVTPYEVIFPLTKKDEFEWLELFEENKKKAQEIQSQINQNENEIDTMVYELYGLTEEEIAIVENI